MLLPAWVWEEEKPAKRTGWCVRRLMNRSFPGRGSEAGRQEEDGEQLPIGGNWTPGGTERPTRIKARKGGIKKQKERGSAPSQWSSASWKFRCVDSCTSWAVPLHGRRHMEKVYLRRHKNTRRRKRSSIGKEKNAKWTNEEHQKSDEKKKSEEYT